MTTIPVDPNVVQFAEMTAATEKGAAILARFEPTELDELHLTQADAIALANTYLQHAQAVALAEVVDRLEGIELELYNRRARYPWPRRMWNRLLRRR